MLTSSLSLVGSIVLCVVFYLRWQLAEAGAVQVASGVTPGAAASPALAASSACCFEPSAAAASKVAASIAGDEQEPELIAWHTPGVYLASRASTEELNADATSRGRWLAERIIHGRRHPSEPPRRGKKGALDVIVVGANLLGISATVHLMQSGLRVLLVDRQSWAPLDASRERLRAAPSDPVPRLRLPLVTGHHVSVVAQRADGMLELQAERAAWYTANVIFASHAAAAAANDGASALGTPLPTALPAASRAA